MILPDTSAASTSGYASRSTYAIIVQIAVLFRFVPLSALARVSVESVYFCRCPDLLRACARVSIVSDISIIFSAISNNAVFCVFWAFWRGFAVQGYNFVPAVSVALRGLFRALLYYIFSVAKLKSVQGCLRVCAILPFVSVYYRHTAAVGFVNTMQKYLFRVNKHNMCICCIPLLRYLPLSVIALIPRYYIFLGNISRACSWRLSLCAYRYIFASKRK